MNVKEIERLQVELLKPIAQQLNRETIESMKANPNLNQENVAKLEVMYNDIVNKPSFQESLNMAKKEMARQELRALGVIYLTKEMIEQLRSRPDVDQEKVERLAYLYDILEEKPEISQKELDLQQEIEETKVIIYEYLKEVREGSVPTYTVYLPKFFAELVPSVLFETGGKGNWHGISTRLNNVLRGAWSYESMRHIYDYLWGKVAITEFERLLEKYGYSLACQDLAMFNKKL